MELMGVDLADQVVRQTPRNQILEVTIMVTKTIKKSLLAVLAVATLGQIMPAVGVNIVNISSNSQTVPDYEETTPAVIVKSAAAGIVTGTGTAFAWFAPRTIMKYYMGKESLNMLEKCGVNLISTAVTLPTCYFLDRLVRKNIIKKPISWIYNSSAILSGIGIGKPLGTTGARKACEIGTSVRNFFGKLKFWGNKADSETNKESASNKTQESASTESVEPVSEASDNAASSETVQTVSEATEKINNVAFIEQQQSWEEATEHEEALKAIELKDKKNRVESTRKMTGSRNNPGLVKKAKKAKEYWQYITGQRDKPAGQ